MGDNENCFNCFILLIKMGISLTLIILNFVWLFPVMINSKKEEPLIEIGTLLVPNYYSLDMDTLRYSKGDCDKNLYDSIEDGIYETFDFKMKEIHKYSTGLVAILFIEIGLEIIFVIALTYAILTDSPNCYAIFFLIYLILPQIVILLNLIFFILFSVYFKKGKIDEFKYYSECSFFDERNFNKTYDYIFIVYNNCKKVFIVDLIYLCISCCSTFINCMKCLFSDKKR